MKKAVNSTVISEDLRLFTIKFSLCESLGSLFSPLGSQSRSSASFASPLGVHWRSTWLLVGALGSPRFRLGIPPGIPLAALGVPDAPQGGAQRSNLSHRGAFVIETWSSHPPDESERPKSCGDVCVCVCFALYLHVLYIPVRYFPRLCDRPSLISHGPPMVAKCDSSHSHLGSTLHSLAPDMFSLALNCFPMRPICRQSEPQ